TAGAEVSRGGPDRGQAPGTRLAAVPRLHCGHLQVRAHDRGADPLPEARGSRAASAGPAGVDAGSGRTQLMAGTEWVGSALAAPRGRSRRRSSVTGPKPRFLLAP